MSAAAQIQHCARPPPTASIMAELRYKLPYLDIPIPMPASDLIVAIVAVALFLPVVVLVHNFFTALLVRKKRKTNG